MDLVTWNPLREMDALLGRSGFPVLRNLEQENWTPVVDIRETKKAYLIKAELPGVEKKDIKLTVENGVLTLQGERHRDVEEKDDKLYRRERFYGRFSRSFSLPEDVVAEQIKAHSRDGVMEITLPKTEVPPSRKTEIKVD